MLTFKKSIAWILVLILAFAAIGCTPASQEDPEGTEPPVAEVNSELKEKFPSFFDLDASNGLTVFVAMFAPDGYSCALYPTGTVDTDSSELWNLNHANLEEMKEILTSYNITPENITVTPYVNMLSSYLSPDLFDDGAIPQLRYKLGIGPEPEVIVEDTSDAPFPYKLAWAGESADGEYALRYTYYPITGSYGYKNELTYVAVGMKNQQELESFISLAEKYFSLNASMPGKDTFSSLVAAYNEEFFLENGIVVVYIPSESTSIGYKLTNAVLDGEELHVTIAENRPEGELKETTAGWFMVVEFPQEILVEANYFSAGK